MTLEELAKLPSPLDARRHEEIPLALRTRAGRGDPDRAPPELVAVVGDDSFLLPQTDSVHWTAQTADGRLLAVPCGNAAAIFDARTGALVRTLVGHTSRALRGAFSPDGKRFACGSDSSAIKVWDVGAGREELTLSGHKGGVYGVAFDAEGKRLASAAGDGVKVWDAGDGRELSSPKDAGAIHHVAFVPGGSCLVGVESGGDNSVKVWDLKTGELTHTLKGHTDAPATVVFSPDGGLLATGGNKAAILWNARTFQRLHVLDGGSGGVLGFTPDGKVLVTAQHQPPEGGTWPLFRWDVKTGAKLATLPLPKRGQLQMGHLSPDGRTVFIVFLSHPLGSWPRVGAYDAETGEERFAPRGHGGAVQAVAVSPDGRTLASGSHDHTVRLWDLAGWRVGEPLPPVRVLKGHTADVWSVAFSPDGKLVASRGNDGLIILWRAAGGREVRKLTGHSTACSYLTFSPDGRTVAAGGEDGAVHRWDVTTGRPLETWRWHGGEVRPVAYSPDGRLLASGGKDGTVQLLDAATGQPQRVFGGSPSFTNLAFSPDGRTLAAVNAAPDPTLRLWDLETKASPRALTGHSADILGLSFHPGGKLAATASQDGTVRLWRATPESQAVRTFDFRSDGPRCAAFTPEGRYLITGLETGSVAILRVAALPPEYAPAPRALPAPADLAKRPCACDSLQRGDIAEELLKMAGRGDKDKAPPELVAVFGEARPVPPCHLNTAAFSPDGKRLAFGGAGDVRLIDLEGKPPRQQTWEQYDPEPNVDSLAFSPDGKLLACAKANGLILLWDVAAGAELRPLARLDSRVTQIAFSPDGALLAASEHEGAVARIWKVATGQLLFTSPPGAAPHAWCVAFSPDGKTLAVGLESGEVRLFDVASGWQMATLAGHGGRVRWLGFHPDGRSLVVAGPLTDNNVFVWDLATRQQPRRLPGHGSEVLSGAWRADGRLLATAGALDGTVRLWDLQGVEPRSKPLAAIPSNVPWLHGIALSPEGRHLAVCNPNGTVYVLRLAKVGEVFQVRNPS